MKILGVHINATGCLIVLIPTVIIIFVAVFVYFMR